MHFRFYVTFAQRQMEGGRCFVYEHPKSAAPWCNPSFEKLASTPGVMRTELDQCEFWLIAEDELDRAPAKKPTSLLTNSIEVDRAMRGKYKGGHRHAHLMAGRARAAAHYQAKFCRVPVQGHEEAGQSRREWATVDLDP